MAMNKLNICILSSLMLSCCYGGFERSPESWTTSSNYRGFGKWDDFTAWIPLAGEWRVKIRGKKDHSENMYLSVGDQFFYIYSNLDDDAQFKDNELSFKFVDLNDDGLKDLLISGMVNYTGKADFEVYEQEDVVFIYLCDLANERFDLKFKKASFNLEVKDDASNQWWKRYASVDSLDEDKYAEIRELDIAKSKGATRAQRKWHYASELVGVTKAEAKKLVKAANQPSGPVIVKRINLNESESTNACLQGAEGGGGSEEINP